MSPRVVPVLLLSVLALASCGSREGDESAEDPASSSPTAAETTAGETSTADPSPTPSPLPTMTPPTAPPSTPSDTFERVRITGTVAEVDGCVQLTDGNGVTWELRGPGLDVLTDGEQVVVSGKALPDEGTCGAPVSVATVETTAS